MRLFALAAVLLCGPTCYAQSVTLPAEVKGSPGAWVIVAPTSVDGGSPRWRIDPALQEVRLDLLLPKDMLGQLKGRVVTGPAGIYKVEAWNAKGDVASEISVCWIKIGDAVPVPPPLPPVPPVPPPPVNPPAKLTAIILEESAQRTATTAAIIASKSLRDQLHAMGHQVRVYDKDVGLGVQLLPKVVAAKVELPALLLAETASGRVREILSLPLSDEAVIQATKKASGE
jgi:hypothetical protein